MKRFHPLILSLVLAAVAFGITRLNAALQASPPVIGGAPGAVLFASAFDDTEAEWETFEGRLSSRVGGGVLKIDIGAENSAPFVPTRWYFADFDLSVAAAAVGGPVENGYGVMFRLRDTKNYYSFIITSDGYYRLAKAIDGVEREISTYIPSDAILTDFGAGNTIRVQGIGDDFRFWINDEPVQLCLADDPEGASTYSGGQCFGTMTGTYTDATHTAGRIGLIGVSGMEPDVSVVFDNLVILQP